MWWKKMARRTIMLAAVLWNSKSAVSATGANRLLFAAKSVFLKFPLLGVKHLAISNKNNKSSIAVNNWSGVTKSGCIFQPELDPIFIICGIPYSFKAICSYLPCW